MDRPLIILDADGVFLTERPYWETALATALCANGIDAPLGSDWRWLTDVAFEKLSLHRVTKQRGCNSNWDLAAVLTVSLREPAICSELADLLARRDWANAIARLAAASNGLWTRDGDGDPLIGFGVDRFGDDYVRVQQLFQRVLTQCDAFNAPGDQSFCGGVQAVRTALTTLRSAGFDLTVCTGRGKSELLAPLAAFDMVGCFNNDRFVTADEVTRAERKTGAGSLGKPHWFPAVCAAIGFDAGCAAILAGRVAKDANGRVVYVGDGIADFKCAAGARSVGLDLQYIHVRSGVTDREQEHVIADESFTIAVVDSLTEAIAPLLNLKQEAAS